MTTPLKELLKKFPSSDIDIRIKQLNEAINLFKQFYLVKKSTNLEFVSDAETIIAIKYFDWIEKFAKPFIEADKLLNAYKIASCTELVITHLQPIKNQDRAINAAFAVFCAMNIIEGIRKPDYFNFDSGRNDLDNKLEGFEKNHYNFLKIIDISDRSTPPVISNAAWWEILHLFYHSRFHAV
jgi:hypothetical protein